MPINQGDEFGWKKQLFETTTVVTIIMTLVALAGQLVAVTFFNNRSEMNDLLIISFVIFLTLLYLMSRSGYTWPRWAYVLAVLVTITFSYPLVNLVSGESLLAYTITFLAASYFVSSRFVLIYTAIFVVFILSLRFIALGGQAQIEQFWNSGNLITSMATFVVIGAVSWAAAKFSENATQRISELTESKSRFIDIVSHQLRTPLTSVRWNLELLSNESFGPLTDEQKNVIEKSHKSEIFVVEEIDSMLMALDIQEGKVEPKMQTVKIDTILNKVLATWKPLITQKNITFKSQIHPNLPELTADPNKISIVIQQLVKNAYDYTQPGGVITATLEKTDQVIRFTISDTGIGIPFKDQPKIFSQFFRGTNAQLAVTDRSGVGLYAAKKLIELHNGKIGFSSLENKGSTFWFELLVNTTS